MKKVILSIGIIATTVLNCYSQVESIVKVGTQIWMSKNLNVEKFRNGETIFYAKTDEEFQKAGENKQAAWCYYENNPENGIKYGKLYNWYAVIDPRGLAPKGWHIPKEAEWKTLENFLKTDLGIKMKNTNGWDSWKPDSLIDCSKCENWSSRFDRTETCSLCNNTLLIPNPEFKEQSGNGSNSSGFSGLPGGKSHADGGGFAMIGRGAYWWTSSRLETTNMAWSRCLFEFNPFLVTEYSKAEFGYSVRCVKD